MSEPSLPQVPALPDLKPAPEIITQPESRLWVEPGGRGHCLKVQAHGEGLLYQWCTRAKDDASETADQRIFREKSPDFKERVNAGSLYRPLYNGHLLTTHQVEEITQDVVGNTNTRKVERLLQWLPKSSARFLDPLISCLRVTQDLGHLELADTLEAALWTPLSTQHCHYDGATNSTLFLCSVSETDEGVYRCRVTNSAGGSTFSEPAHVQLVKPCDAAVDAFIADLQASPESGAELALGLISRLQRGSSVSLIVACQNMGGA
jgi:hypothetical protein